jgi:lysyl-tRNA synthetase class 1
MDVMLPTLGEERQQTYSPFLPISPRSGKVLLAKVTETHPSKGTITYVEEDGTLEEVPVTGGHCKLQWKPDMGMRWAALGVDYEMYGKDHLTSAQLYDAICRIAGGTPPEQFMFELFLDEKGQKISKSKGNGITIDEWLRYAPMESLSYYMFQSPRKAKRLYFDVIPQQVDDYLTWIEKYDAEPEEAKKLDNPVWHIHSGHPPKPETGLKFSLLLNLASVCNPQDKSVLWSFISRYMPQATPATCPFLDRLAGYAVAYYHDFIKPTKKYRAPNDVERQAMTDLEAYLMANPGATPEEIQTEVYALGKKYPFPDLKLWFAALYEVLLGQPTGPRMGTFIALYGSKETAALIARVLKGESLAA